MYPTRFAVSPPLSSMPHDQSRPALSLKEEVEPNKPGLENRVAIEADTAVQGVSGPPLTATAAASFDGVNANGIAPPDTNMAVGPTRILHTVNSRYAVYDRSGNLLVGPNSLSSLWGPLGADNGCAINNGGDVIAQYDKSADRWLISQVGSLSPPYSECIAVSKTNDPGGIYSLYYYDYGSVLNDYPKFSVWPTATNSAYLATYNVFAPSLNIDGVQLCAYDRSQMLAGNPTPAALCQIITNDASYLPADLDGSTGPLDGSPGYFLTIETPTTLRMYNGAPNFANNTFTVTGPRDIAVTPYVDACAESRFCIQQQGTTMFLDAVGDRPMYRLSYRNFGDREELVVNHSVTAGIGVGVRWYELSSAPVSNSAVFNVVQQGTFAPDANSRWMGSAAIDRYGDIAIGYSVSGPNLYPAIRYTGRVPGDPPGTMEAEASLIEGLGSQDASNGRWGDYSAMRIDPVDDCTFWYTNQYQPANGSFNWNTRIGSFRFPGCTPPPTFAIAATPASLSVSPGIPGSSTITATAQNGFAGTVTLSVSGCPFGATCTFNPAQIVLAVNGTGSSTLTVTPGAGTANGAYTLVVNGTSGSLSPPIQIPLTVTTPDFSITVNPASLTLAQGQGAPSTVTLTSSGGFSGSTGLSVAGCPQAATCSLNPASATLTANGTATSQLNVTLGAATPPGPYALTVTGAGPGNIPLHTAGISLTALAVTSTAVIGISPEPSAAGQTYSVSYAVTSSAGTPSGSVKVSDGIAVNTCTVAAGACSLASATPGTKTINVNYPGNSSFAPSTASASHAVIPVQLVLPAVVTASLGQSIPLSLTLSGPASSSVVVALTSSDTSKVTVSPAYIYIAPGATAPSSPALVAGADFGSAVITAAAYNFQPLTRQVQVSTAASLWPKSVALKPGATQNLSVVLSTSAPNGVTLALSSSNTGVATVPATVTIPPGGTSAPVLVTAAGGGSAVIHASALPGVADTTANITVLGPLTIMPAPLASGQVGVFYSQTLAAAGGAPPYLWALTSGALPGGLTLNAATGLISGTPTSPVTNTPLTFTVTDSSSPMQTAVTNVTLTIAPSGGAATLSPAAGTPQTAVVNTVFSTPLSVLVRDSNNRPVSGAVVTFAAPTAGPGGSFAGGLNTAASNAAGVATSAPFTANGKAGSYSVTASTPGGVSAAVFLLTNTAGVAANVQVAGGNGQRAAINTAFTAPLVVVVTDSWGNPISGAPVTFTAAASGPSASFAGSVSAAAPTGANGQAASPLPAANSLPGGYTVVANTPNTVSTASFALTNTGPPAKIAVTSGNGQSAAIGAAFAKPLVVTVTDSGGTPVQGATVVFVPPVSGPGGAFAGPGSAITDVSGVAASGVFTANGTAGGYTVSAQCGAAPPVSFSLTNVSGISAPAAMTVSPGQSVPLTVALSTAPSQPIIIGLTSSDTSRATVSPAYVYVAQGTTSPNTVPQVTGTGLGSAVITVSAFNFPPVTTQVQVAYTLKFLQGSLSISHGATQNLILLLSAAAPAGGLTVNLSSSNTGAATVPASITIPGGQSAMALPVTGVAAGSAGITASAPNCIGTPATVTVN
jgi:hypothetical protein